MNQDFIFKNANIYIYNFDSQTFHLFTRLSMMCIKPVKLKHRAQLVPDFKKICVWLFYDLPSTQHSLCLKSVLINCVDMKV